VAQPANPAWNGAGGYTLAANVASQAVPVQAASAGTGGNIQPGAIGLIGSAIPGVDTVSNTAAFSGGVNAESDAAFRARFTLYINSRSLATAGAIDFAIASLQQGLRYTVLENVDTAGNTVPGNFCVVVDDGTGSPPAGLIANASAAVEAVRPIGTTYAVTGPVVVPVTVLMTIQTSNAATAPAVALAIQQAIMAWIATVPIAGTLAASKLEAIAHATDPSVISVTSTTINGAAADITIADNAVMLPASVIVN